MSLFVRGEGRTPFNPLQKAKKTAKKMINYLGFSNKELGLIGKFLHFGGLSAAPPRIHTKRLTGAPTPLPLPESPDLDQ